MRWMSSGSPSIHAPKPAHASRLLSAIASSKRSFAGKNDSTSITPMRGRWVFEFPESSAAISRSRPSLPGAAEDIGEEECASRLLIGSASMPTKPSRPLTVVFTRSRINSLSSRIAGGGAAKELRIETESRRCCPACRCETRPRRVGVGCVRRPDPNWRGLFPELGLLRGESQPAKGLSCAPRLH